MAMFEDLKNLTKEQFVEILRDPEITTSDTAKMLQCHYEFDGHQAYASQIGRQLGHNGRNPSAPIIVAVANFAKRIARKYDIQYEIRIKRQEKWWHLFFNGQHEGRYFLWELKSELVAAIEEVGLVDAPDDNMDAMEIPYDEASSLVEGAKHTILVNAYERNREAHKRCITEKGYACSVCGFDFYDAYGKIGKNYIHMHHIVALSEIGNEYIIGPIRDLVPICPNCHAMLHHERKKTMSIEELKHHRSAQKK